MGLRDGEAGPSTGVQGDLPGGLPSGAWTFSFGMVHTSDVESPVPVPGGTPRTLELAPADVACSQRLVVGDEILDRLQVAFTRGRCEVVVETAIP